MTQIKPTYLQNIPENWEVKKLKYIFKFQTGWTPSTANQNLFEGNNIWVTIGDLNNKFIDNSEMQISDEAIKESRIKLVPKGALMYSFKLSIGKVAFALTDLYTNEAIISILPNQNYDLRFYYYSLPLNLISSANENIYGAKLLNQDLINNAFIVFPPLPEQTAIANYLDHKTAEIDTLIAQKTKLLDLLQEEEKAFINEKLSGKGKKWQKKKVNWAFEIIGSGTTPNTSSDKYYENGTVNWVNTGDLNDGILTECAKKITELAFQEHSTLKIYPKNTLLIALYGATIGKVGLMDFEACTNQACCALAKSKLFDMKFIFYWFIANKEYIVNLSYGGGQPNISQEVIKNLRIICPPLPIQAQIVNEIESHLFRSREIGENLRKQVALLKEYRQSLISEKVLGIR